MTWRRATCSLKVQAAVIEVAESLGYHIAITKQEIVIHGLDGDNMQELDAFVALADEYLETML